jgi:hypothetical protein
MAVHDEVHVPDAIELDGGKPARSLGQLFQVFPPLPQLLVPRQKSAREFALPLNGARDPFERNVLNPAVHDMAQMEPLAHLVEGEQIGGALEEVRQEVLYDRGSPGGIESVHGG